MAVTIVDVAQKAGVSPSTVSRVISNDTRISQKTCRKVRKVMEELGYHPNMLAKSLVTKTTNNIGIVLPRPADELFQNQFFSEIIRGIVTKAASNGYDVLMTAGTNQIEEEKAVERLVQGRYVDGIILLSSRRDDQIISFLRDKQFPFVLVGRSNQYADIISVDNDNIAAAYDITRNLIQQGHRKIAFVSGPLNLTVSKDRIDGYNKALLEAGIQMRQEYMFEGTFTAQSSIEVTDQILELEDQPTAIIAIDDLVAFSIIRSLWNKGWRVPEKYSVVGFNNTLLSEMCLPPISSVDIGIYQMGNTTAQALIQCIKGDGFAQARIIMPHQLIWRESVQTLHT
ncbi:LacI family transcriptional regulator [Paenibacillus sp. ACRRX]|uniref:LacI family DNA-binding transcriptional regulator n=1 Tax=unclassified Paenibacillus TaxID=185978 RepID=UPI001EF51C3B|nr:MULTISPECIES: LacI family DNA-binding transcriptional regulator [unclassified Paenibacillus]MCG7407918.1 LacI family transcriptional regulator [Paenibacillus sp. ACRRX]MDK8181694.1 LacI family DNA-binding transcriptional regulator [Paenibacillus sp. UMB4589-SE434]